jgi:hypothetical protein
VPYGGGIYGDSQGWLPSVNTTNLNATWCGTPAVYYVTVNVMVSGIRGPEKIYKKLTCNQNGQWSVVTLPLYTAIIYLGNGVPSGVTWDDGCFSCLAATCSPNTLNTNTSQVVPVTAANNLQGCTSSCFMNKPDANCDLRVRRACRRRRCARAGTA